MRRKVDQFRRIIVVDRSFLIREKLANLISRLKPDSEVIPVEHLKKIPTFEHNSDEQVVLVEAFALIDENEKNAAFLTDLSGKFRIIVYADRAFMEMVRRRIGLLNDSIKVIEISEVFKCLNVDEWIEKNDLVRK